MALTELSTYTINDVYNLPDGQRAELIDGKVYYMAPATRNHQRIVGELFATIREHIRRNNFKGEVDITPFGVFIDADDKSYVEPDICIICDENKLDERGCNGAHDRPADGLTIPQNFLSTARRACVNTGLSMRTRAE